MDYLAGIGTFHLKKDFPEKMDWPIAQLTQLSELPSLRVGSLSCTEDNLV